MTPQTSAPAPTGRRPYVVLAVGVLAYLFAIMQRTTLGVSGLEAAERFSVTPSVLSAFVFVQVVVYVLMQIPAGLLVDRWGSRLVVSVGAAGMAVGQLLLAVTTSMPLAVLGRVVVGAGDALVFVAVVTLIPHWFPSRRVPLMTQLTLILGQLGQLLSAIPFLALLDAAGWPAAFSSAAALSLLAAVLAIAVVRNGPVGAWSPQPAASVREIVAELREVWRRPGTRLGFFGHMVTQFPMMVFVLLWGVPYLVSAQGLPAGTVSGLLTVFVFCGIAIGPLIGILTMRHPLRRSWLLLGVAVATAATWTAVLLLDGPAPLWLLVLLMVVLASGGPGSVVGFDIARTSNPSSSTGLAQSMVNLGGFIATLGVLMLVGLVLDLQGGYTFEAFRAAWLVLYPFWVIATIGVLVTRRKARRVLLETEGIAPRPLREVVLSGRGRR